ASRLRISRRKRHSLKVVAMNQELSRVQLGCNSQAAAACSSENVPRSLPGALLFARRLLQSSRRKSRRRPIQVGTVIANQPQEGAREQRAVRAPVDNVRLHLLPRRHRPVCGFVRSSHGCLFHGTHLQADLREEGANLLVAPLRQDRCRLSETRPRGRVGLGNDRVQRWFSRTDGGENDGPERAVGEHAGAGGGHHAADPVAVVARGGYPRTPFESIDAAWAWVERFVDWYNGEHRHSAIGFVTPDERHRGHDVRVLLARRDVYAAARRRHPARWSQHPRNWNAPATVSLNRRDRQTSARASESLRIGATPTTSMVPASATTASNAPLRHHAESAPPACTSDGIYLDTHRPRHALVPRS